MGATPISWLDIPVYTGNLEQLEKDITSLRKDAGKIRSTGADTHSKFQGLSAYYKAPETAQLLATTKPVRDRAEDFALQLERVAEALDTYATEIRPLVKRLETLSSEAFAFEAEVEGDDTWNRDEAKKDKNNKLVSGVKMVQAQFWAAERSCASKIRVLLGLPPLVADDGSHGKNMYGLSVADMKKVGKTPWGSVVQKDLPWYKDAAVGTKRFVWDGLVEGGLFATLRGIGTLVNPFGDDFGKAWTGLGKVLGGIGAYAKEPFDWGGKMAGEGDSKTEQDLKNAAGDFAKALVAYDEWGNDPAKAAGTTTFNAITMLTAPTGASKAAKAVRAAQLIDPVRAFTKAASVGVAKVPKLSGVLAQLKDLGAAKAVELSDGTYALRDGTPVPVRGPLPEGHRAVEIPDGRVKLDDDVFLHPDNSLRNADGDAIQPARDVPHERSAAERATTPSAAPEHELAGVGARQDPGDLTARANADGPTPRDPATAREIPGEAGTSRDIPEPRGGSNSPGQGGTPGRGAPGEHLPEGGRGSPESPRSDNAGGWGEEPGRSRNSATHNAGDSSTPDGTLPESPSGGNPVTSSGDTSPAAGGQPFVRGSEAESNLREALKDLPGPQRPKPKVLEKALDRLAARPDGQQIADIITSGKFVRNENFGKVVSFLGSGKVSHVDPAISQLRFADELHANGFRDIAFEVQNKDGMDVDVLVRDSDGRSFGYQMKGLNNPASPFDEITRDKYLRQLQVSEFTHKVMLVDGQGTLADWTRRGIPGELMEVHKGTHSLKRDKGMGISFVVRLDDGMLVIPPGARVYPGSTP
ncbi:hypothetical protein LHJ74_20040 [Streptomyces sp. N2-109]|uniref:Uncharacterized protein n=2 Tax=Streptomyces gossypii TaxID=2883101 RepID=A0ABT2JW77_9ACTN|nr:hypothetical protein [Streptomyces gossypii]